MKKNNRSENHHQHEIVEDQLFLCSWQQTFPKVQTSIKLTNAPNKKRSNLIKLALVNSPEPSSSTRHVGMFEGMFIAAKQK